MSDLPESKRLAQLRALHDLDAARAMTPADRIGVLDAPMLRAEALRQPEPDREPIRYGDMRM